MTEQVSYSPLDIGSSTEQCVNSEYCSQNCGVCQANCELHRLRRGVLDLVGLLEADYVSECEVCVDPAVQRETVEMRNVLERAGDDLIPSTPLLCVSCYRHFNPHTIYFCPYWGCFINLNIKTCEHVQCIICVCLHKLT